MENYHDVCFFVMILNSLFDMDIIPIEYTMQNVSVDTIDCSG